MPTTTATSDHAAPARPDLSEVPASCPFVVLDHVGEVAGWCETEDGADRTCAEWGAIDGTTYTWITV